MPTQWHLFDICGIRRSHCGRLGLMYVSNFTGIIVVMAGDLFSDFRGFWGHYGLQTALRQRINKITIEAFLEIFPVIWIQHKSFDGNGGRILFKVITNLIKFSQFQQAKCHQRRASLRRGVRVRWRWSNANSSQGLGPKATKLSGCHQDIWVKSAILVKIEKLLLVKLGPGLTCVAAKCQACFVQFETCPLAISVVLIQKILWVGILFKSVSNHVLSPIQSSLTCLWPYVAMRHIYLLNLVFAYLYLYGFCLLREYLCRAPAMDLTDGGGGAAERGPSFEGDISG